METSVTANEIADYLLWLWSQEPVEDRDFFTPMKLQKLLYYVQGWSIVQRDCPAFNETIEAWTYGPVVREVWAQYKERSREPIQKGPKTEPQLSPDIARLIRQVWDYYKRFSAWELSRRTHDELPWKEARGDTPQGERCSTALRLETMRSEFRQQLQHAKRRLHEHRNTIRTMAAYNTRKLTGRDAL